MPLSGPMEAESKIVDDPDAPPPHKEKSEGLYFWVAIVGFFLMMMENGVRSVMNVFVEDMRNQTFSAFSKHQIDTGVVVIPSSSSLMAGPLVAICYQVFGARIGIMSGGILTAIGFCVGSLSTSIYHLYFFSTLIGIGCGLIRNSIISVQCEYFDVHCNFVISFMCIGPGIGILCFPNIFRSMLLTMSWQRVWQIIGAAYILCALAGTLITRRPSSKQHSIAHFTGLKVWTHRPFAVQCVASSFGAAISILYITQILRLMKESHVDDPAFIYSVNGVASIAGRMLLTFVMSCGCIPVAIIMVGNYVIAMTAIFAASFCYSARTFLMENFFSGFGIGLFQASYAAFLLEIVGPEDLPGALGFTNFINGITALVTIQLTGVVDPTQVSTRQTFMYGGGPIAAAAIFFAVLTTVLLMREEKKERGNAEEEAKLRKMASESIDDA